LLAVGAAWFVLTQKPKAPPPMTAKIVVAPPDPVTLVLRAQPKNEYEDAVLSMYYVMQAPDTMQQLCARWFPAHGAKVADAFVQWRNRHAALMKDITDRTHEIWVSQGGGDPRVVRVVEHFKRNERYQEFMRDFDRMPTAEFDVRCADYPRVVGSRAWNLPVKFRRELEIMRATSASAADR
jgi:hypothetical protein